MPTRSRGASREELAVWAREGVDLIGVQAVREKAERTAYLDYGERGIGTNTPAESAELRGMWPSVRRLDAANNGAYQLRRALAADLLGVPVTEVEYSARPGAAAGERATSRAVTTAGLDAGVARAERRASVLETLSNPQATPAEITWARNWVPRPRTPQRTLQGCLRT
jgi:hypothetical protein